MKNLLFLILLSCFTINVKCDPITYLNKWQAEKASIYLQNENFIFIYCDCCENSSLQIIQLDKAQMEPTENNLYQVRVRGSKILSFSTNELGLFDNPVITSEVFNDLISINQTFAIQDNKLLPLFKILSITKDESGFSINSCQSFINIPNSNLKCFDANTKYKDWYSKNTSIVDYQKFITGEWSLRLILDKWGKSLMQNLPLWRFNFKSDGTYITNIGNGLAGKWSIKDNYIMVTNDEIVNSVDYVPFYLKDDLLQLKINDKTMGLSFLYFAKK